ncbi:MAG: ABC transporter permease [Pseudomonadota bacterium]
MSDQAATADQGPNPDVYDELPDAPPKSRLRLSVTGKVCVAIVAFWVLMAFIGPWIAPYGEAHFIEDDALGNPIDDPSFMLPDMSLTVLFGTDYIGRDVLSRIIWGARTTIGISFIATMLAYFVGITLGIAAAVAGKWVDAVLSRLVDAILAFPNIMLGLIIIAAFGSSIPLLIFLAGLVYAASVFRIARALGQDIMVQDFVEAARARGEGLWWIISREVLPNAAMPLATDFGLRLVFVILFISSLSFLGLGVQPPISDWGSMVRENLQGLGNGLGGGALASITPALAIASLTIAINLIVDDISAQAGGSLAKKMT